MKILRVFSCFAIFVGFGLLAGCGGSGSSSTTLPPNTISTSGNNVLPISVNGGPVGGYPDAAFASVTVCLPETSTCQTVENVLVDTGSSGLRVLSSAMTLALPAENASNGDPMVECFPFVSGNTWGPVQMADVEVAGETASSVPIQVLNQTAFSYTGYCTSPQDDVESLGANGILGVGLFTPDCGLPSSPTCLASYEVYFDCASTTSCSAIDATAAQQVSNPVAFFTTDNNGVIVELPAVSGAEASVSGSLVFGIGTESNNALGSASIYSADGDGSFTTTYSGQTYASSFIDSGSNGYFFLEPGSVGAPPVCSDDSGFYCPTSTENLSASNQGSNGTSGTVNFSVANADTLFNNETDNAFGDLGGPATNSAPTYFDWGLPFFFGRNVFVGLQSTTYANGYWAY